MKIQTVMIKKQNGFTLVELLVVVAIIGILASIAYPSYQDSVLKSRRKDAEGALLGFSNAMERHFTESNSYCDAGSTGANSCGVAGTLDTGPSTIFATKSPVSGSATYYNLTISAVTDMSYTLSAVPAGGQASDSCGTLTIQHTGGKGVSSSTVAQCW